MIVEAAIAAAGAIVAVLSVRKAARIKALDDKVRRKILEENEEIVEAWRASRPDAKYLRIEHSVKPPGVFSPTITVRRTYTRDWW